MYGSVPAFVVLFSILKPEYHLSNTSMHPSFRWGKSVMYFQSLCNSIRLSCRCIGRLLSGVSISWGVM
jgi:hypothetical protein